LVHKERYSECEFDAISLNLSILARKSLSESACAQKMCDLALAQEFGGHEEETGAYGVKGYGTSTTFPNRCSPLRCYWEPDTRRARPIGETMNFFNTLLVIGKRGEVNFG